MNLFPVLLLALAILCLCAFLGNGARIFYYLAGKRHRNRMQGSGWADALLTGELILTGLVGTAHVAAVFTGQSFSRCVAFFLGIMGAALLLAAVLFLFYLIGNGVTRREKKEGGEPSASHVGIGPDPTERFLTGLFWILVVSQLLFLLWNAGVYAAGDMTVEAVGSFLETDGIYRVDPMTGRAYAEGIPSRLKILCLPTLYGILCRLSGLSPERVVTAAVPVWIFVSSYAAFFCVGRSLFPESRKKSISFLIAVVIIMWAGCGFRSMDGFSLLYCGYRGVTVRNLVLIPYLLSLCLRKRWKTVFLCILAEACIAWTLYGLGACLLTAAGLFLAERGRQDGRTS